MFVWLLVSRTGEEEELEGHDGSVAHVEHGRHKLGNLKPREEIEDRVEEHVEGRRARGEESPPPPVVVLRDEERRKVGLVLVWPGLQVSDARTSEQSWK